jgi:hypothetical protein
MSPSSLNLAICIRIIPPHFGRQKILIFYGVNELPKERLVIANRGGVIANNPAV